ncbi:DUF4231 domain-containing protein [Streptomyces melanogenes]|uniref:DUF4231 domain-containing protein n=1 Tax=Streptomyces melanogenes TaxID=67326 RepID=UPI00167D3A02|nr:DUF4231 domain-containing protein [Streptomyces melanogenes]GGP32014.1 hypothetical protein GCM10010278_01990 [Streptomyces melanogenes]
MAVTQDESAIAAVWDQQNVWSRSADRLKKAVEGARGKALLLAILAAVLGTGSAQAMGRNEAAGKALAFAAALAAGAAPLFAQRGGASRLSDWIRVRAVSEALKAEVYTCLARVGPYRDLAGAGALLAERGRAYRTDGGDLIRYTAGITALQRPLPPVTDLDSYVEHRLRRQIETYYRPKAEWMRRKVVLAGRVELALGGLAAALAAAAGVFSVGGLAAWVPVVASVSVALTAHAIAQRYSYQQLEFMRTAEELERLSVRWEGVPGGVTPEAAEAFVAECEHVISIQNEAWMIRWTVG